MQREASPHASHPSTTRREILALGAVAAGAGLLSTASAKGAARFPPLKQKKVRAAPKAGEPVKIGVIGIGDSGNTPAMGYAHCERICALAKEGREKVQIVAISDVAEPYLKRAIDMCSKEQGITVEGHKDYRQLLARDDIHGVLIATPEHWHAKMAMDAIQAGLD